MSRFSLPLGLYLAVTLVLPIVRGTTNGPVGDHALIVLGAALLVAAPLAVAARYRAGRRRTQASSAGRNAAENARRCSGLE